MMKRCRRRLWQEDSQGIAFAFAAQPAESTIDRNPLYRNVISLPNFQTGRVPSRFKRCREAHADRAGAAYLRGKQAVEKMLRDGMYGSSMECTRRLGGVFSQ